VSFLVVSVFILLVSFLVVSTTVVLLESVTLVVSVVLVDLVPLQAAKDKAIIAAKPNLVMFFIVLNCFLIVMKLSRAIFNLF
jgi:hypothetical protein